MHQNRILGLLSEGAVVTRLGPAGPEWTAFAACPACLVQGTWQLGLYQQAYEQARATVAARALERAYSFSVN